jgi:hypothetical protein
MRFPARSLLTGAAAFALVSCVSDRSVSPSGVPTVSGNPALRALVVAQSFDLVIPRAGGTLDIAGVYRLDFPANAVCDPNAADTQAGYAAQAWDASCTLSTSDTPIRATVKYTNGNLYVDFQPSLRFNPATTVTLSSNVLAPVIQYFHSAGMKYGTTIVFAPAIDAAGVVDAASDASLKTKVNGSSGVISRRIKHFTGYMTWTGFTWVPCDPLLGDPNCVYVEDPD